MDTLILLDLASGHVLKTFPGFSTSLAISPDGRRALAGYQDGTIKLWDLESGQLLCTAIAATYGPDYLV